MIKIDSLTKYFGEIQALDNLSLNIKKGELLGIIGPNGAGKTTTIRIICGILKPDMGTVFVGGHDVLEDPITTKSMIGYLPEEPNLYERFKHAICLDILVNFMGSQKKSLTIEFMSFLSLLEWKIV